jgi:lipid-A-disaccharide synthase-like uncharacterized protein
MEYTGFLAPYVGPLWPGLYADSRWWTVVGLLGNGIFSMRFVLQWLVSEKNKRLTVPPIFWHLSFWGSILALIYALHLDKAPVILGYVALPFLYGRNLWLLYFGRKD